MNTLRLLLGDQLNSQHSWFSKMDNKVTYCMFEMKQETDYVTHHRLKVIGVFLAMRAFAEKLKAHGHKVIYYTLDDSRNKQSLTENLLQLINELSIDKLEYQDPDEYRLDQQLIEFCSNLYIPSQHVDSEHFYTSRLELYEFIDKKKNVPMELFYRYMRKKHQVLIHGSIPEGNQWNFDHENRNKWKKTDPSPTTLNFNHTVIEINELLDKMNVKTMGITNDLFFDFPINREESLVLLDHFIQHDLPYFGTFQDAMHTEQPLLFHSKLSFALNLKLISPKEVIDRVLEYYYQHIETINLSQVEGFIRQILGWREYIRGMYWMEMPSYKHLNYFKHKRPLPDYYWNGDTKMNCLKHALKQSLDIAYAHHIQRLMIIGNFSLLAQLDPIAVDQWYLGVYIDAFEWVQLPNTRGMSQYADGGKIATKPYVSSSNYIYKMSNYCTSCHYSQKERHTEKACPFNSLYWNFLLINEDKLRSNFRMKMMYRQLDKMNQDEKNRIIDKSNSLLSNLASL